MIPPDIGPYLLNSNLNATAITGQLFFPSLVVGVDSIKLSFPAPARLNVTSWQTRSFSRGAVTVCRQVIRAGVQGGGGGPVHLTYVRSPHLNDVFVSFNPAGVRGQTSGRLLTVTDCLQLLQHTVRPAVQNMVRTTAVTSWNLYRLDLAVDAETGPWTQQLLRDAAEVVYRPRHHTFIYMNGQYTLATVGRRSATRPRINIYDKAQESGNPPNRVRFEVQSRRPALRAVGIRTVAELTSRSARDHFQNELRELAALGATPSGQLRHLVLSPADQKTALEMIGVLTSRRAGVHVEVPNSMERRHREFLQRHSLSSPAQLL